MTEVASERNIWKQMVSNAAAERVENGMLVGLGTGTTANYFIHALARRIQAGLQVVSTVASSQASSDLAASLGIPVGNLDTYPELDLYIDGADEIDPQLNLIKGGGGALLREKIVASAARRFIVIADITKLVPRLGVHFPLPIETLSFGATPVQRHLATMGANPRLRMTDNDPFLTDGHNFVLDCAFPDGIAHPADLDAHLHSIPGILETGLFLQLAREAIIAGPDGIQVLQAIS